MTGIVGYNDLESALVTLTRMLTSGASQPEILHELCQHAMRALQISDVGVSLAGPDGVLRVIQTATALARLVDGYQASLQEGPCRQAFEEGRLILATGDDLIEGWPRFGPFAVAHGIYGVAAFPLHVGGQSIGVLDCYWTDSDQELAGPALSVAQAIADAATVFVIHARETADAAAEVIADLQEANAALHDSQIAAEAANNAKTNLLSRTSHELRTPLNAIMGFAQVIQLQYPEVLDINEIITAGRHLVKLVDDVLDIAIIEAGELSLVNEAVSVEELVSDSIRLVSPLARVRNITLATSDNSALPPVEVDRRRAIQIMLNLLSNAIKYNVDDGHVTVECRLLDSRVEISVVDTGPGISDEDIKKLFTPFERLGAERTGIEGTGVGLALCKTLVEHMGGKITATSEPGVGSTFSFDLPALPA